jgi:hypothetical protein
MVNDEYEADVGSIIDKQILSLMIHAVSPKNLSLKVTQVLVLSSYPV